MWLIIAICVAAGAFLQIVCSIGGSTPVQGLRTKRELHIRRKVQHAASGLFVAYLQWLYGWGSIAVGVVGVICGLLLAVHLARKKYPAVGRAYIKVFAPIMRSHEATQLPGAFWFVLAAGFTTGLFPLKIAVLCTLLLGFGDPAASLFGVLYGDRTAKLPGGKSVAGSAACFAVCSVVSLMYFTVMSPAIAAHTGLLLGVSVVCGLVCAIAEWIDVGVDDNMSFPIIFGAAATLLFNATGLINLL